jgi:hypothetical protein
MLARKAKWTHRPDIISYVCDCYAGTEPGVAGGPKRRVWLWEEAGLIMMGNTQAFYEHLCQRFELLPSKTGAASLHTMLRDLGEVVQPHKPHGPRGPITGAYQVPEADSWVVGKVEGVAEEPPVE